MDQITPLNFAMVVGALLIVGICCMWMARKPSQPTFDQLDAKRVDMEVQQATKEDQWIAELEGLVIEQKTNLAILRMMPPTTENLDARGSAVISIGGAERTLAHLYERKRGGPDRRETAANHFEGRV